MRHFATLLVLCLVATAARAVPAPTVTYQGELQLDGQPVTDTCDFELALYPTPTGGSPVAGPTAAAGITVVDGRFTAPITGWPADAWAGDRWLEIAVTCPAGGSPTTLSPRTPITSAPTAALALAVGSDSVDGAAIVDGSVDTADLAPGAVQAGDIATGAVGTAQIDASQIQRRIDSPCPAGEAVTAVAETGSVTCAPLGAANWHGYTGLVATTDRVSVGLLGYRGAKVLIQSDSGITSPELDLAELGEDFSRLSFSTIGSSPDFHYDFWTIAAHSSLAANGGPATDRINFYNSRAGDLMSLVGSGRLGIGVIDPQNQLDVNGSARLRSLGDGTRTGNVPVLVQPDGDLVADSNTHWITVPGAAFRPYFSSTEYVGTVTIQPVAGANDEVSAPFMLPDGARVIAANAWLLDNSADTDLQVTLREAPMTITGTYAYDAWSSSSTGAALRNFAASDVSDFPVIDNLTSTYMVSVHPVLAGSSSLTTWKGSLTAVRAVLILYQQ